LDESPLSWHDCEQDSGRVDTATCSVRLRRRKADHAGLPAWQTQQLHNRKHHGLQGVLDHLHSCVVGQLSVPLITENLANLEKRAAHMQYPTVQAQGWPIGSGTVESANTLVVEARLKGAGMHWAREGEFRAGLRNAE